MMSKTILITGATGYIGAWTVKMALEKGYTVHATVRDLKDKNKYQFLQNIANNSKGSIKFFEADLLKEGSFEEAMKNCDWVFHIASPFTLRFKDAEKELLIPALKGTENIIKTANKNLNIKNVIVTSSVAAVCGDNKDMADLGLSEFNEDYFNTTSSATHQPYSYSKIIAEKKAWELSLEQNHYHLKVINPGFVLGPSISKNSNSESLNFMKDILSGKFLIGAPDLMFGFVDVRDVAKAHILAAENNDFTGRCIVVNQNYNVIQLAKVIANFYPHKWKLPKFKAPKFLLKLVATLFGVTAKFIENNVGHPVYFNSDKSKKILGLQYIPIQNTLKDMIESLKS